MNGPRFNHFFHYLLDIHNLKIEGKVKTLANPLNVKRLETILEERVRQEKVEEEDDVGQVVEEDNDVGLDDVTMVYYEQDCDCTSMCRTKKCPCFTKTCSETCHPKNTKCKNK